METVCRPCPNRFSQIGMFYEILQSQCKIIFYQDTQFSAKKLDAKLSTKRKVFPEELRPSNGHVSHDYPPLPKNKGRYFRSRPGKAKKFAIANSFLLLGKQSLLHHDIIPREDAPTGDLANCSSLTTWSKRCR